MVVCTQGMGEGAGTKVDLARYLMMYAQVLVVESNAYKVEIGG